MDDLLAEFLTETAECMDTLDVELVRLEQNPNDPEILSNIFRLVHTVKGTCGFLGLPRLEAVAHASENVLGKVRDGLLDVTPAGISLILQSLDRIKEISAVLEQTEHEPEGDDAELISQINALAEGNSPLSGPAADAVPATDVMLADSAPDDDEIPDTAADEAATADVAPPNQDEVFPVAAELLEEVAQANDTASAAAPVTVVAEAVEVPLLALPPEPAAEAPMADVSAVSEAAPEPESGQSAAAQDFLETAQRAEEEATPPPPSETAAKATVVDDGSKAGESSLATQSIRVHVEVLEDLMTMVSELVLTRNQLMQIHRAQDTSDDFAAPLQSLNYIVSELQEGVMKTRMQPIGNAWSKLARIVRDLAHDLGKKIDLRMHGQETELDRQVLELIRDPLTHMVRNSADHGLETPKERIKAGKPETGVGCRPVGGCRW